MVLEPQQRRLHDRAHTLGFSDLGSYLVARSQQVASLAQLASELDTTVEVVGLWGAEILIHHAATS